METFNNLSVVNTNDHLLIDNSLFTVQKSGMMLKLSDIDKLDNKMTLPANKKNFQLSLISYLPETNVHNYRVIL